MFRAGVPHNKQTNKQTNKHATKQTNKHTNKQPDRQADKQTNKQAGKQTNKQANAHTVQKNKQANKQTTCFFQLVYLTVCVLLLFRFGRRWCSKHWEQVNVERRKGFWCRTGFHAYSENWDTELRLAGRLGFLVPTLLPPDWVVWAHACETLVGPPQAGSPIPPHAIVVLFFAHGLKWPQAVAHFVQQWRRPLQASSQPQAASQQFRTTGDEIILHLHRTLLWLSGQPLQKTHAGMSHGLSHAVSGAAIFGQQLGMLTEASSPNSGNIVTLGTAGHRYVLQEDVVAAWTFAAAILSAAEAASPILWPSSSDLPLFASTMLDVALDWRHVGVGTGTTLVGGGSPGKRRKILDKGPTSGSNYHVKHWTRAWLLVAAGAGSDSQVMEWTGSMTMGELQMYMPDVRDHTWPVGSMRLGDVQQLFGFSPLWLSWLCCCIGYASDNHAALTAASDVDLELASRTDDERPAASDAACVDWWPADPVSMGKCLVAAS